MSIKEAFALLLNTPALYEKTTLPEHSRRQFVYKLKNKPDTVREDTMKKWLIQAGFRENASWKAPTKKSQL